MERFIKLGEIEGCKTEVIKETEKAIQIRQQRTRVGLSGKPRTTETEEWLPKSQINRVGDYIIIPDWLVEKKNIFAFRIVVDPDVIDDVREITAEQRPALLEQGAAKIEW